MTQAGDGDIEAIVQAAGHALGRPVRLERVLTGGTHATTLVVSDGARSLVVRRFPAGDDAVERELTVLPVIAPLGELVPELVAVGDDATRPVIVTTLLPGGHPPSGLSPAVIGRRMGVALARVHAQAPRGLPTGPTAPPRGDGALARRARAAWPSLDVSERVLTHRDFWCGNALWRHDAITGIVDWTGACAAPRGVDIAWCRQDLVLLGDPHAADIMLRAYERESGVEVTDVRDWDVQAAASAEDRVETWAPNYAGIGRVETTAETLRARLDAWNAAL